MCQVRCRYRRFNDIEMKKTGYVSPQTEELFQPWTIRIIKSEFSWHGGVIMYMQRKKRHRAVMLGRECNGIGDCRAQYRLFNDWPK